MTYKKGDRIGHMTIISDEYMVYDPKFKQRRKYYKLKCDCGTIVSRRASLVAKHEYCDLRQCALLKAKAEAQAETQSKPNTDYGDPIKRIDLSLEMLQNMNIPIDGGSRVSIDTGTILIIKNQLNLVKKSIFQFQQTKTMLEDQIKSLQSTKQ